MPLKAMFSGCICCFSEVDIDDFMVGCLYERQCLCLKDECCIAANGTPKPVGLVQDSEFICKLGLFCCACGLKSNILPLCSGVGQCLFCKSAASFPFDSATVPAPVCAVCFIQCLPEQGLFKPAPQVSIPKGAAPDSSEMAR
mmetsp:Transcript_44932/g.111871  ORF Transcript_44932/g.111871 Transcript_44932/m.111871 type:complete len:142 (-) Transcript_44932:379-804(-)|eukprot:CAMPEP_0182820272 /NCGR_PEP_ID=MMETSP0006_2-20121128/13040_1 /TAXON_ID=97485 /ORGANISM="Prymnesium parvum, Strain Texoma1" /LENGTH=141 /DNA_ID=CAMNT_0024946935 /DNA_START=47 /DNA_END=472 /DNA_ORIENTATION=-